MARRRDSRRTPAGVSRRRFIGKAAMAGAALLAPGLLRARRARAAEAAPAGGRKGDLRIGMIGVGSQGRNLLIDCLKIPHIRIAAVADIWDYSRTYAVNILKEYGQQAAGYRDHRELLAHAKDLDAVIVATPDWVHAEQTIACLTAGLHVYCEKEMATSIEDARAMVATAKEAGRLLQIGHQRRSNVRYLHAEKMIWKEHLLGRMTHTFGQWNRDTSKSQDLGWPKGKELPAADLASYGYDTMERFRNWRWYRKFSSGPIADLGSHQVDVFNWFVRANPAGIVAAGGGDYYPAREWGDHAMAIYEYRTALGQVRGFYQVLNTTSQGGYFETFMGDQGSLQISEDPSVGFIFREPVAQKREWEDDADKVKSMGRDAIELKVGETRLPDGSRNPKALALVNESKKPVHQPHLENFFGAVRGTGFLNCPGETAFATAVTILKTDEAIAKGCRVELRPEDFIA